MFERVAPTEEQLDAEAREGRSENQIAALRLAAVLFMIDAALAIALSAALKTIGLISLAWMAVRIVMAYYLFKLRPRAEALALGLAILAGINGLVSIALGRFSVFAFLIAIPALGTAVAFLLLLVGDPPRERRTAAAITFAMLNVLPVLVLIVLSLTGVVQHVLAAAE